MLVCVVLSCLFLAALWSLAGKGLTSWLSCVVCFLTFPNVSWITSELRVRSALCNWFKPSSKIVYWRFQGGTSFVFFSVLCLLCLCAVLPVPSVYMCLVVTCWERAALLARSRLWCLTMSLLLSHWYPGTGVLLDCIDSWPLHPYLLSYLKWVGVFQKYDSH